MSQIQTKFIADDAITSAKLATGAVDNTAVGTGIDAAKIADGSVSNTEFQYISTLTSNAQTQLDGKADETIEVQTAANSGMSGGGDLTANRPLVVDPNNATSTTVAGGDLLLVADVSDSNNLKKVTAQSIADLAAGGSFAKETFTLSAGDITNQYVTLANTPIANSVMLIVKGGAPTLEGAAHDFTLTGAQLDFENDLATGGAAALIAGDIIQVMYQY